MRMMLQTGGTIPPGTHRKTQRGALLAWMRNLLVCALIVLLFCTFVLQPIRVSGESMRNTLQNGELMLVTKYDYLLGDPSRFDIVICHFPGEGQTMFVKRVVGVPGDTVAIRNGTLYLNGEPVEELYIDRAPNYTMPDTIVGAGQYFVLGDNRASSMDSHIVGQLSREQILGHVRQVVWPLSAFRAV